MYFQNVAWLPVKKYLKAEVNSMGPTAMGPMGFIVSARFPAPSDLSFRGLLSFL